MGVRKKGDVERAQAEHDQHIDPSKPTRDGDLIVYSRASDKSLWWRMSAIVEKYSMVILSGIITALAAIGYQVITPSKRLAEIDEKFTSKVGLINARMDTLVVRQDSLKHTHERLEINMSIIVRSQCLSPFLSKQSKLLAGLIDSQGNCVADGRPPR